MAITTVPAETSLAGGFADLAAFLAATPVICRRLQGRRIVSIPVDGDTPEERIADLHDIARDLGTVVEWRGPGYFSAARHFGGVTLEAHYTPGQLITARDAWADAADGAAA